MAPSSRTPIGRFVPILTAIVLLLFSGGPVWAQSEGTITGLIRDVSTQEPISNAQVFIEGTSMGSLTNTDGRYLLPGVPAGEVVVRVQSIGHGTEERTARVVAGETVTLNFELGATALQLNEIVVTGAGVAQERRRLGNTIATLDTRTLETAPIDDVSEMLMGREPGVVAMGGGGMTGEGARIRIRGSASLSQSNEPVVYVDGVRMDNAGGFAPGISTGSAGGGATSRLDDLNPESIERIEILKGAAAATLYGTEASNGVIQIFTKRGRTGATQFNMSVEQGIIDHPQSRMPPLAGFVLAEEPSRRPHGTDIGTRGVREFYGLDVQPFEVFEVPGATRVLGTGHSQTYSLSVQGGSEIMNYYVSGRFQRTDGPSDGAWLAEPGFDVANDVNEKRQINANLEFFPWDDLRVRVTSQYSEVLHEVPQENNNTESAFGLVMMGRPEVATEDNLFGNAAFATAREAFHTLTEQTVRRFGGSLTAGYTLTPTINLDATFGLDLTYQGAIQERPFGWAVDDFTGRDPDGWRRRGLRENRQATIDMKGTWSTTFGEDWSSEFVGGVQGLLSSTDREFGTGERFPGPGLNVVGAGADQSVFESRLKQAQVGVLAQYQLGWKDFVFPTVGARLDEHSAFGETAGAALYPKASISVIPSQRPGFDLGPISTLRLRGAVGTSGLQPGAFDKFTTFAPLPSSEGPGAVPENLGNEDLEPERSLEWEVGAEFGLWEDRAAIEVTYWDRTVTDALVARQFSPSGGFRASQLDNIGEIQAHGVDLDLNVQAVNRPNFSLSLFANGAFLRERVTDMGGAPPIELGYARVRYRIQEGYAPGAFFPAVLDESLEYPIHLGNCDPLSESELLDFLSVPRNPSLIHPMVLDCGTAGVFDHNVGKPTPDWQGSFGAGLNLWRNFSVRTQFDYQAGDVWHHDLMLSFRRENPVIGRNMRKSAQVESILLNPASTAQERLEAAQIWVRDLRGFTPYRGLNQIRRSDFVRLRELSLTYRVPPSLAQRFGADRLSLTVAGRNLALWTRYDGTDPESQDHGRTEEASLEGNFGTGHSHYGRGLSRRYEFSLRVGF